MLRLFFFVLIAGTLLSCQSQTTSKPPIASLDPLPGAYQISSYIEQLRGKKIALCVNHTSLIGTTHLIDSLQSLQIEVVKVFTPEHGFRGQADAGEKVSDEEIGNLEIVSLYGKNKKPTSDQLSGVELMIFDMQDVGTRFFTYISTMHYLMEACAESNIQVIIFDRPNPNDFIDGPILDTAFQSFVGMHTIPVVHGMTVGELAIMINGEGWLKRGIKCDLSIIPIANWKHGDSYTLPIKPSPNLPNQQAINWYPTLCFFEGTYFSVGRGTPFPFQVVGSDSYPDTSFTFTPTSRPGAKYPKFEDIPCYGIDLRKQTAPKKIDLDLLLNLYSLSDKDDFFTPYFNTLAGTDELMKHIKGGLSSQEIRSSWKKELDEYRSLRKKYLLYPDERKGIPNN